MIQLEAYTLGCLPPGLQLLGDKGFNASLLKINTNEVCSLSVYLGEGRVKNIASINYLPIPISDQKGNFNYVDTIAPWSFQLGTLKKIKCYHFIPAPALEPFHCCLPFFQHHPPQQLWMPTNLEKNCTEIAY